MNENVLKTGTTTVGIKCREGIVLAADTRATAGTMIVDKKAEKVHKIMNNIALTIAGSVSDVQLIIKILKAELTLKDIKTYRPSTVKEAANLLASMTYQNIRKMSMLPGIAHFILGGFDDNEKRHFHLYDIFPDGSLTEIQDYISSGSGSVFAYGVLESDYTAKISVDEAVELAKKSVNTALKRDSASGNGIDVITITKDGIRRLPELRVNEEAI
ncbi:proteasome subunit beta [Candidatus Woesearchaeota archaeon]|nr:proteasome subunit beta [Candidatus Woesearchaeota archaeon]